ncbi:MAG: hypothetical protein HGA22_07630 [Clostridiales bacterium]|nr:hypothetical protein [Clostridiales bacterium]
MVGDAGKASAHYGSDQEWFSKWWKRLSGCGPSVATNLLLYSIRLDALKNSSGHPGELSRSEVSEFMEEVWNYVTPGVKGLNTTYKFHTGLSAYSRDKNLNICHKVLDVPKSRKVRPALPEVTDFLAEALNQDCPVAFLNLDNGEEKKLDAWHWVTVTGMEKDINDHSHSVLLHIIDNGVELTLNLAKWLHTTKLGGGFVYFTRG